MSKEDPGGNVAKAVELSIANFEALGVLEDEGRVYLPTVIRRRNAKGGLNEIKILLTVPTNRQLDMARKLSRELAIDRGYEIKQTIKGIDAPDKDRLDELENYCILWYAIREPNTKGQFEPTPADLYDNFSQSSLGEVWSRYQMWLDIVDPRYGKLDGEDLWRATVEVATAGNMLFLVGMSGSEQATCIVSMAQEALLSPNAPPWASSRSTSKQDC